jgi:ATP-dependent RNA helicase RhlE
MYRQQFNGNKRIQYSTYGRSSFRGRRNEKSFNPTLMVTNSVMSTAVIEPYVSINKFEDFQISEILKKNVIQKGYITPTPIQDQAIKPILEGRDVIGSANTGTGKTAAFLIPLIDKVIKNKQEKVLIITPTRELAVQIQDEFMSFSRGLGINAVLCIGGSNMFRQKNDLRRPHNFVIGTPGRIKDMVNTKSIDLGSFHSVVLDEADRMVDIGFIGDIKFFIYLLPKNRQSLFFSATIDGKVKEIINTFVNNPVYVAVQKQDVTGNIKQETLKIIDINSKVDQLHDYLIKEECEKVLIFGRTKWGVQKLSDELERRGFKADAIHGNKRQNQRIRTLERFKRSEIKILIATDVASRGLDIPNVSHVINFDLPENQDAYIHRIGRTGRADKTGVAVTFV